MIVSSSVVVKGLVVSRHLRVLLRSSPRTTPLASRTAQHQHTRTISTALACTLTTRPDATAWDSSTAQSQQPIPCCKTLFELELPEGKCVALQTSDSASSDDDDCSSSTCWSTESLLSKTHWIHSYLHPAEVTYGAQQPSDYARQTFLLGRLAMRRVLLPCENFALLKDDHGRPTLPPGNLGSISHKRSFCQSLVTGVAFVTQSSNPNMGVGVDIEYTHSKRRSIAKRVLTPHEIQQLGSIESVSKEEEVLLRFSLKEAFYKAIHPLICQYISFQEAEVYPRQDGTAEVFWNLQSGAHVQIEQETAHWRRMGDFFLTSASVTLQENDENTTTTR